jgi:hypothetical protein
MHSFLRFLVGVVALGTVACNDAAAPPAIPATPESVFLTTRLREILVNWNGLPDGAEILNVEVSVNDGPFLPLGQFPKSANRATYPDAQGGMLYKFRISACNRSGCSAARELTLNTDGWLEPTLQRLVPTVDNVAAVRMSVTYEDHGHDLDIAVNLRSVTDPNEYHVRGESVRGGQFRVREYFFFGLQQGAEYFYTVTLTNQYGSFVSEPRRILIHFAIPVIVAVGVDKIERTQADFHVLVRPGGAGASLFVQAVPADSAYPSTASAVASRNVEPQPDGVTTVPVTFTLFSLQPDTEYKARVFAKNAAGTSAFSPEMRFRTLP